ncbi:hypothetical protein OJAV_G00012080 [Oryzias javanicus]|uniref:IRS-type PTB domain-containing protein n=1 Tax=Oryzias javanicus TaxID=123683 RepID=A0A437DP05_ORYJA|nr:hypothetical protein OJAV_G00012080 [Oryzias javanicus]
MWVWPNYHLPDVYQQLTVGGADPSLMDSGSKTGKVYLRPHKPGKKWKPVWLSLLPPSSSGVGRLEIQDVAGGGAAGDLSSGVRRHHPHLDRKVKVVRLSEVLSVLRLPPNAEACPMENMSAFCVESQDRTLVFAALKDDCVDWVDKLCLSSFKTGNSSGTAPARMEENQIYASADAAQQFWVAVQKTEAATRCGLEGSFWLEVGGASLLLRDAQKKNVVGEWPYEQLRRYGSHQSVLTIEAGRRCSSGPGIFGFESSQEVPVLGGGATPPGRPGGSTGRHACAHHPYAPPTAANADPALQESRSPPVRRDLRGSGGVCPAQREAPPNQSAVHRPRQRPPSETPGGRRQPPPQADRQDSVYSEVLDRVSPHQNRQGGDPGTERPEEPVYAEPAGGPKPEPDRTGNKPDPFAHLYARVCKPAPHKAPSPESETRTGATRLTRGEEPPDDVIYESLGII